MLKTASSTLSRIAWLRIAAIGADTFGSPRVCGEIGSAASTIAETSAITRLLAGPAAATRMKSRR